MPLAHENGPGFKFIDEPQESKCSRFQLEVPTSIGKVKFLQRNVSPNPTFAELAVDGI